jgi:hypothetical protein
MNTPLLRTFVTLALLAVLGRPAAATDPGEALVFPGCGKTIQQCIDAAPNGGMVLLATDDTIDGDVTITRSVTLAAAPGYRPVLSPASNIFARSAGGGDKFLVVRGLTWEPAGASTAIRVLHDGDGAYDVQLLDNDILGLQGSGFSAVISVQTTQPGPGGPLILNVRGNTLQLPPGSRWPIEIELPWTVNGITVVEQNVIDTADTGQPGAIFFRHWEGEMLFYAIHNVIRTANPAQTAIEVYQSGDGVGDGRIQARIFGNLLRGIDGGMRFGTSLYAERGTIDLLVAHNTIVDANIRAVQVGGRDDQGADVSGVIANNVLARSGRGDVGIHEFGDQVLETNNLLTVMDPEGFPSEPGPYSILVTDPGFAAADDFHLAPTSPAINKADPAHTPAELMFDLDGQPRVAGPAADLGAFELPCAPGDDAPHCEPTCTATTCQSGDPCYVAGCVGDMCRTTPVEGFLNAALCACDRPLPSACAGALVPTRITRRAANACIQIDRVIPDSSLRQITKRVRSAQRNWSKARKLLASPRSGVPAACAAALSAQYDDASRRAGRLTEA